MKWSWKLGEYRGIALYMHATFLILIAFVVLNQWSESHSVLKTLEGVAFVLALFSCVVLHEDVSEFLRIASTIGERSTRNATVNLESTKTWR